MLDQFDGHAPSERRRPTSGSACNPPVGREQTIPSPTRPSDNAVPHARGQARAPGVPRVPRPFVSRARHLPPSSPASAEPGGAFSRSRKWADRKPPDVQRQRAASLSRAGPGIRPANRAQPENAGQSTAAPIAPTSPVRPPGRAVSSPQRPARQPSAPSASGMPDAVSRSATALAETAASGAALSHGDSDKRESVQDSGAQAGGAGKNGAVFLAAQNARRMKRQMQRRQAEHAAGKGVEATAATVRGAAARAKRFFKALAKINGKVLLAVAAIALLILFLIAAFSSCAALFTGALNGVASVTFAASDADIDRAEAYYSAKEADLREQIKNAPQTYPGYGGYEYEIGAIGHNPIALIAYLTTVYGDFSFDTIRPDLDALFDTQYRLTFTSRQSGNQSILIVKLDAQDFVTLATSKLSGTENGVSSFNSYLQSKGNRQYFANPFSFGWSQYLTLLSDNRASVDVPAGTQVLAALDGTVTRADGGTVVITGSDGLSAEYDGCGSIQVSVGQTVTKGANVALTSSAFSMLFLCDGEHLNPSIFADTGDTADNAPVLIGGQPVGGGVEAYRETVTLLASQYGMSDYVNLILAVMEQESDGQGGDPMQASEGPLNTEYPKAPDGITDPVYSIECGIQELHQDLQLAGCTGPTDMADVALALQGYNFGSGFILWAQGRGGYTLANAQVFAQAEAETLGWSSYGDPYYVPHVLRYYKTT